MIIPKDYGFFRTKVEGDNWGRTGNSLFLTYIGSHYLIVLRNVLILCTTQYLYVCVNI